MQGKRESGSHEAGALPNTYEVPSCQETHYPSERIFCFFPPWFWRSHPLATCSDFIATAWRRPHMAAPHTS
jgi:hypothetical protein